MPKYRLSVDETRNTLKYVDIETSLNETEIDSLLNKIENDKEITCGEDIAKELQVRGIKVNKIIPGTHNYYIKAETLEIEELEEPKRRGLMVQCKACNLSKKDIEQAIEAAREKMNISIEKNGTQASITIELSQELDTLIVSEMKNGYEDTGK